VSTVDPRARMALMQMLFGFMGAQVINVTARLGIADALGNGARTTDELAAGTKTHAPSLHRLLRALACLGVVAEVEPRRFELTALGQPLRADAPNSMRWLAMLFCDDPVWRSWGHLEDSVRTGEVSWDKVVGTSPFEYFKTHPEQSATFNAAMAEDARNTAPMVLAAYDFASVGTLVDVGGGSGTLLATILAATPKLRGIVFDTPAGMDRAAETLARVGVADRARAVAGDFFQSVPEGGDAYILKSVIHDWDDARSRTILQSCRRAMGAGGKLLLVEPLLPPKVESPAITGMVMSDLNMLVVAGGRERTEVEFRALLESAGFVLTSISAPLAPTTYRLIEGCPA